MTFRFSSFLTLLLAAFALVSCQEEDNFAPSEIAPNAPESALADNFEAEDADMLQLDDDVYVSSAEIAQMTKKYESELKSRRHLRASTVYTQTNAAAGNDVVVFTAAEDGTLTETGRFRTQGEGSDDNLNNQGALFLDNRNSLLYAVNAGSNELTVFHVNRDGTLGFIDKVATQGTRPVSVTAYENIAYVVNAGSSTVEGFRLTRGGHLRQLPNSVRPLSTDGPVGPSQISFKPNGRALLVTERATNSLTSYEVRNNGRLSRKPNVTPSAGRTPFGFDFLRGRTIVSEAAGGDEDQATASVYRLGNNGRVRVLDGPVALNATATCWISTNRRTGNIFATNTLSNSISSLGLHGNDLVFTNGGATTPAEFTVHDAGQNRAGTYLYAVTIGSDLVISYRIGDNGFLEQIDTDPTEAEFASGIVVRR